MRTLVLPDIHNKHLIAQRVIDSVKADEVVLLGDYFDDWGDGVRSIAKTGIWLDGILEWPEVVGLLGNHDASYASPIYRCSGWTQDKQDHLDDIDTLPNLKKLKLWHQTQGWLLSHAGFGSRFAQDASVDLEDPGCHQRVHDEFWAALRAGKRHPVGFTSAVSGGSDPYDGPLWHRPTSEIKYGDSYYPDINQIFGHTIQRDPTWSQDIYGDRLKLDTNLRHYAVITDGDLKVHEIKGS